MANRRQRRRKARATNQGTMPGSPYFVTPARKDAQGQYLVPVVRPKGLPDHLTPIAYQVSMRATGDTLLMHGAKVGPTWSSGRIEAGDWNDDTITASGKDAVSVESMFWYKK